MLSRRSAHLEWLKIGPAAADAPGLERYDEGFNPETGLGGFEIWIPVVK